MPGVLNTQVGYTGGSFPFPTYQAVCSGITGHSEAIWIRYDPASVSYQELLDVFWANHSAFYPSPTQYMSAIFYTNKEQQAIATESIANLTLQRNRAPVTKLLKAKKWHAAEDYHQHYIAKRRGSRLY